MTAEGYLVIEQDEPYTPQKIIKGPDRNARPEIRFELAFIDFDMTSRVRELLYEYEQEKE